jgi:hypothetical protein
MRWRRLFRLPPKPTPTRIVWKAQRTDGKCWAGEYRWQGKTFTNHKPFIYLWGSELACRTAIEAWGFANVYPVEVEFDGSVKRPQKRRDNNHPRRR